MTMDKFLLQDTRELIGSRISWWCRTGGYTTNLEMAEIFTREGAVAQHTSRETDVPWPLDFVESRLELAVDFQYLRIHWVPQHENEPCYVGLKLDHDGNDIRWVGPDSTLPDLSMASVFQLSEALSRFGSESDSYRYQIWPKVFVDAIARPIASALKMSIDLALEGTGIKLLERPIKKRAAPKCYGCGRFVTADQAPSGLCRDCR